MGEDLLGLDRGLGWRAPFLPLLFPPRLLFRFAKFLKIGAKMTWARPRWEERAEKQGRELVVHYSFAIWSREPAFLLNLETGTRESE